MRVRRSARRQGEGRDAGRAGIDGRMLASLRLSVGKPSPSTPAPTRCPFTNWTTTTPRARGSTGIPVRARSCACNSPKSSRPNSAITSRSTGSTSPTGAFGPSRTSRTTPASNACAMYYNDKPVCDIVLADTYRWQNVMFDDIMVNEGDNRDLRNPRNLPRRPFRQRRNHGVHPPGRALAACPGAALLHRHALRQLPGLVAREDALDRTRDEMRTGQNRE